MRVSKMDELRGLAKCCGSCSVLAEKNCAVKESRNHGWNPFLYFISNRNRLELMRQIYYNYSDEFEQKAMECFESPSEPSCQHFTFDPLMALNQHEQRSLSLANILRLNFLAQ